MRALQRAGSCGGGVILRVPRGDVWPVGTLGSQPSVTMGLMARAVTLIHTPDTSYHCSAVM